MGPPTGADTEAGKLDDMNIVSEMDNLGLQRESPTATFGPPAATQRLPIDLQNAWCPRPDADDDQCSLDSVASEVAHVSPDLYPTIGQLAAYGVERGFVAETRAPTEPCGLLMRHTGQWLWMLDSLGFYPEWASVLDSRLESALRSTFPHGMAVHSRVSARFIQDRPVPCVFADHCLSAQSEVFNAPCVNWVFMVGKMRRPPRGWRAKFIRVKHSEVEGVSASAEILTVLGRDRVWNLSAPAVTFAPGSPNKRDVMSVADDLLPGLSHAPLPPRTSSTVQVVKLGSNLWSGAGLLPVGSSRHARFVLPSTMSRTKWVSRRLTLKERWLAMDVPDVIVQQLSPAVLSQRLGGLRAGNCLKAAAQHLFQSQGLTNAQGVLQHDALWAPPRAPPFCAGPDMVVDECGAPGFARYFVEVPATGRPAPAQYSCHKRRREAFGDELRGMHAHTPHVAQIEDDSDLGPLPDEGGRCTSKPAGSCTSTTDTTQRDSLESVSVEETLRDESLGAGEWRIDEEDHDREEVIRGQDESLRACSSQQTDKLNGPDEQETRPVGTGGRPQATKADAAKVPDGIGGKATKDDDAKVDINLWNDFFSRSTGIDVSTESTKTLLDWTRNRLLRLYKRKVTREFIGWTKRRQARWKTKAPCVSAQLVSDQSSSSFKTQYIWSEKGKTEYQKWWRWRHKAQRRNLVAGGEAVARVANSSWWEWDDGSAPFFWRWPKAYQEVIRDGLKVWLHDEGPRNLKPQRPEKDPEVKQKMRSKLKKVRGRRYICPGVVKSLTNFFSVPKGLTDIRMVYDGTASGLNLRMWLPRFPLPTAETHLRGLEPGTFMADVDVGECFLNFHLHESIQALCGVDFTDIFSDEIKDSERQVLWERWVRCAMGLKSSPYQVCQAILIAEEAIKGDRTDKDNVFHWDSVRLNLPGQPDYDPALPWVAKVRSGSDSKIAADLYIYVDDARITGATEMECWRAARRVASYFNYLGVQDAARKLRAPSQQPGAWAGSVLTTDDTNVGVRVSQEKWDKAKGMIEVTLAELETGGLLNHKTLEKQRGFLQYVTRTYPAMVPYMRGYHNTLDCWRENRDSKTGWYIRTGTAKRRKQAETAIRKGAGPQSSEWQEEDVEFEEALSPPETPPAAVAAVARFKGDLGALRYLFSAATPPTRLVRTKKRYEVQYGFGDASATGFGATIGRDEGSQFYYGQWCTEMIEESSNYRELTNLVKFMKEQVESGDLKDCEVFLFTDNTTAEAAYWNGNTTSPGLLNAVIELRKLEMDGNLKLHVVHVSGKRMQRQGTDGLSRADFQQGVMRGEPMLKFVPLNKRPDEVQPQLLDWVKSWWPERDCGGLQIHTDPADWFSTCHENGNHLWSAQPAAADVVAEELGRAKHKRPNNCHIVMVPRLMKNRWYRKLRRESTFVFEIPAGTPGVWDAQNFEPLLMFVSLPLYRHAPWDIKGTPFVENFCGLLRSMWDGPDAGKRHLLRKFFTQQSRLDAMQQDVVQGLLQSPGWRPLPHKVLEGRG